MEVILAIGAVQAVFFAALLYNKSNRALSDLVLSCWLLIIAVHLAINYLELLGFYSKFPHLVGSTSSLVFLYGPLLYIYVDTTISQKIKFKREYLYHFIPFLLYNLALIPFYIKSGAEKLAYSEGLWQQGPELLEGILLLIKALIGPVYIVISLRLLSTHRRQIGDLFSNHELIDLNWLRYLIWSMAVVLILFFGLTIAKVNVPEVAMSDTELIIFLAMSVWILALGYYGIKQAPVFAQLAPPTVSRQTSQKKITVDPHLYTAEKTRLIQIMEEEKPYLQNKLTLQDLASRLNIPAHQLSQLINREFGQNFFELINSFRVEEVKRKLSDPSYRNLTLLGIAQDSGFNSKASFNRIFKKVTGQTPNEYQKAIDS
ncbi:MAG: helix-turn-helix domain-containing protein [Cyclobacteriaceae bacterium]|nr:helix-turn-helix domain-containing protein [Cyclobacteriaceae bacterium]